jgi:hypothetical protein
VIGVGEYGQNVCREEAEYKLLAITSSLTGSPEGTGGLMMRVVNWARIWHFLSNST